MRVLLVITFVIAVMALKAQVILPVNFTDYAQRQSIARNSLLNDSSNQKKWSLSKYTGISAGFAFFRGGQATVVSAPIGLQLNRRINNNLYAFAGVSAAPAYVNFNRSFLGADANKAYPNNAFLKTNSFGMYSRAELGLMYVNDARTFSISGSIGIERNSYPIAPYNYLNPVKPNPVVPRN